MNTAELLAGRLDRGRLLQRKAHSDAQVEGLRGGHKLSIGFWKSNDTSGWFVEARAAKLPLLLSVARHRVGDRAVIARGAMVDLEIGDTEFDRVWRIEGAPVDTAKRVLDAEVRSLLAPFDAVLLVDERKISLCPVGDKRVDPSFEELDAAATLVATVAARVALAGRELAPGDPSRAARREEVKRLKASREELWARATWWERLVLVVVGLLLLAGACGFVYGTFF